ncbi:MAG: 3-oxo-tetronate kinase [Pseudomonadota bacterium]
MSIALGCIADDFTGASDLAAILARSGRQVGLRIGVPPADDASPPAPFEVIALKCRTEPVDEAVAVTGKAADWLMARGAGQLYWKYCSTFDSTPDGNIGPVSEALMDKLGTKQTIYCPAFPENGRSIYMGNLFVGDVPLDESPMRDHPLTPMRDANLMRLLTPQVEGKVGHIAWPEVAKGAAHIAGQLRALAYNGIQHIVPDAISQSDLAAISEAVQDFKLITGGSALALDLPRLLAAKGSVAATGGEITAPATAAGNIVLSGSCSAMTRAQVADYCGSAASFRLDPLALADGPDALAQARQWLASQDPNAAKIIYATAEPADVAAAQEQLGRDKAGQVVEDALAALAGDAFELGVRRFVVAGGETSGAVTQALATDRLSVGREVAPGVPWCFAERGGETFAITLKSGNFGAEDFFTRALKMLG